MLRVAARAAEDAGDYGGALRLVKRLPETGLTWRWMRQLEAVRTMPEEAAQRAVWLVHPAVRWAHERPAGELLERLARLLLLTLGLHGVERDQFIGRVASADPVVLDAGLFGGGLFARYLGEAAGAKVLAQAGPVGSWASYEPSVWRVERLGGDVVQLYDLWSLEVVRAVAWPAASEMSAGALVFGRLVPVGGPVGWAFALAPVRVDQRCAVRLLRARRRGAGPDERIRAVGRFRRRERERREAA